jgi:hypothetical protein
MLEWLKDYLILPDSTYIPGWLKDVWRGVILATYRHHDNSSQKKRRTSSLCPGGCNASWDDKWKPVEAFYCTEQVEVESSLLVKIHLDCSNPALHHHLRPLFAIKQDCVLDIDHLTCPTTCPFSKDKNVMTIQLAINFHSYTVQWNWHQCHDLQNIASV